MLWGGGLVLWCWVLALEPVSRKEGRRGRKEGRKGGRGALLNYMALHQGDTIDRQMDGMGCFEELFGEGNSLPRSTYLNTV